MKFTDDNSGKAKRVIVQVKKRPRQIGDIRDLVGTVDREGAAEHDRRGYRLRRDRDRHGLGHAALDPLARAQELDDLLAGQDGLGDVIEHGSHRTISRDLAAHRVRELES